MADFGMTIKVTEGANDGPPVKNAQGTGYVGAYVDGDTVTPAVTGADGTMVLDGVMIQVSAQGFADYRGAYHRPSLQAPVPVSLQRLP